MRNRKNDKINQLQTNIECGDIKLVCWCQILPITLDSCATVQHKNKIYKLVENV